MGRRLSWEWEKRGAGADDRASGGREEANERNDEGRGPIVKSRAQ